MADSGKEKRKFKRTKANFTIVYDLYKPLSASMSTGGQIWRIKMPREEITKNN
ncbi:MAG: hypothetical protein ABIG56_06140 [Candidatus Omnitrophota bacterium]